MSLGVSLLVAVGALLHSAVSRLEEQRRLRHRMVAERVFDEVEREISLVLEHEAKRPSAAYDARDTDPTYWFPFVVGYYRRDPALSVIARDRLGDERLGRLRRAVEGVSTELDEAAASPRPKRKNAALEDSDDSGDRSSPDILRQLNRSVKVRARRQHELSETFVVLRTAGDDLVVERQSPDMRRREGFVLDVSTLIATIQHSVLGAQGLDAVATLSTPASSDSSVAEGFEFAHTMAPPLDSQTIRLRLSQLDDEDAGGVLYGLTALFILAAIGGLLALYRAVAIQVRFAERRNNFVSAVTHELKTPLTAIRMYGEMLRDGMVEDEATRQEYYATITAEGERLTRLINNVMEHGRLRRGLRPTHLQVADVGAIVRGVVDLMAPHIRDLGFELHVEIDPDLPTAQLDVDAFKQVLFNVLDNALKYGRNPGNDRLQVGCVARDGGICVSVRDYGPGVGEAHERLIFEPFFRGEDEMTRRQKGTGIGLSLVRDLVELMGGRVRALNRRPGFEVEIALSAS